MYGPEGVDLELVELGRRIPELTPVSTGTSAEVRDLYEANPYPRWRRLSRGAPMDLDQNLRLLTAGEWDPPGFLQRPRLLVAGCGTGRDLLNAAWTWRPAAVTGFDLSRISLAYARQMAERMGIEVELYHADLLQLDGWDRQFDAVVCTGVLHHLEDPLDGLAPPAAAAAPRRRHAGGPVQRDGPPGHRGRAGRGPGTRTCRRRPRASGRHGPTWGACRRTIRHVGCTVLPDFYYGSGCRDLLFHVREHRFTLPRIAAALDELGLTFLAFETDGAVRRLYRTLFGPGASLEYWEKLEQLYPGTFLGMYQFWCQKGDR